jgi:Glyoxalase/Bleomycin resistance protein/Dioxygenase superfamily
MEPYFHVGLVVSNLERAMDELGPALGTTWTHVSERAIGEWEVRVAFAVDGPPFLELIEGSPGSPWDPSRHAGLHHLAWWSEDRVAERERLGIAGFRHEVGGTCVAPVSGLRIQLKDTAERAAFRERWGLRDAGQES